MGTYLYAHVEYSDAGVWFHICDWDFRKAYELMDAIDSNSDGTIATVGWPADTFLHADEMKSDVYAKRTTTLAQLVKVDTGMFYTWEYGMFKALLESCKALEAAGMPVRVLWGRD